MWQVENRTPFAAERAWVRDREGAEVWLVAVRATFAVAPDGSTRIADEQTPVVRAPVYSGAPGVSSLLYDTDLARTKPCTDVVAVACAHAPGGEPATSVDVSLRVGPVSKSLHVVGDRVWTRGIVGLDLGAPTPFVRMPITYERAYGGADPEDAPRRAWDRRNPVGTGFATDRRTLIGRIAPNIESAGFGLAAVESKPVGFGPIPGDWPGRVEFGGTYGEAWEKDRAPLLPEDFDDRFYQCAPRDQRAKGHLTGGEPVELVNLTPGGRLAFSLPRVSLGMSTHFKDGVVHHRPVLHTVILEPEHPRVTLVYHSALPCHHRVLNLQRTVVFQKTPVNRAPAMAGAEEDA